MHLSRTTASALLVVAWVSPVVLAQAPVNTESLLKNLPRPRGSMAVRTTLAPNAVGQKSLLYQVKMAPGEALQFFRSALGSQGYRERPVNTVSGVWGFSMVFDLPATVNLKPTIPANQVVLVYQGTVTAPQTLTISARFEEILTTTTPPSPASTPPTPETWPVGPPASPRTLLSLAANSTRY